MKTNEKPLVYSNEDDVYLQRIFVPFEYPVCFTRNVFHGDNPVFNSTVDRLNESRQHRMLVYVDDAVAQAHPRLIPQIKEYFHARRGILELAGPPESIRGGEQVKNSWHGVRDIMWMIGSQHLCRQSFVVAIGGGSVLDMVGFATSLVHRGLRLIRLPTTVLGQADAGVGVKNGMNVHGMKNFSGTFAPPFAVINDYSFLPTLEDKDWLGGIAEAFKVAIIKDEPFFDFLIQNAESLRRRDRAPMEALIRRCAILHLEHTRLGGDPFEYGSARPLDFGHWSAHKLEAMADYTIGHGQAVSIGIALDSYYAMRQHLITAVEMDKILEGLARCGLPVWHDLLEERTVEGLLRIHEGLDQFREHLGGTLTLTLPKGIGNKCEVHWMNADYLEDGIRYLKRRYHHHAASE